MPMPTDFAAICDPRGDTARRIISEAEMAKAARSSKQGGIKDIALGRTDAYQLSPFDIRVRADWNGRDWSLPENQEHVRNLAASIAVRGVEVPLSVTWEDGAPWLNDGESRLRAVLLLINEEGHYIPTVPAMTDKTRTCDEERVAGMLVRNSGKPFNTLEKAGIVRRLLDAGKTLEWVQAQTGLTVARLRQLLEVDALPESVREQVAQGVVSATTAVQVVREHGEEAPDLIERAAAASSEAGGKKAGRATPASLEAVARPQDASEASSLDAGEPWASQEISSPSERPKIGCKAVLEILRDATAIEEAGEVAVYISIADWDRISALF